MTLRRTGPPASSLGGAEWIGRSGSALEQELDAVAEEVLDLLGEGPVLRQVRILVEDADRHLAGLQHVRDVAREPTELEVADAGLAVAEDLPRSPDLQVALGEEEAVGRLRHRRHPRLTVRRGWVGEQEAPRRAATTTHAPSELVQLRQPEPVRVLDDHHGR